MDSRPAPDPDPASRALEVGCFRILFENSSDPHLVFDGEGIVDCNEAAVHLLGCTDRCEVLDLHPAELSPERQPDGQASLEKAAEMDRLARAHGVHRFEWVHQAKDGTPLPVHVTLNPVRSGPRELMVAVWHDLRDLKERERELVEASDALRRLNADLQAANETMRRSLLAAAQVQEALLPAKDLVLPGLKSKWAWRPSSHIGGDALNIFRLGKARVGFFLLDVSGHGVAAALWAVGVSQLLLPGRETSLVQRPGEEDPRPPEEVVRLLNEHLVGTPGQRGFLTLFYGVLDVPSGHLCYVAAGHGGTYLALRGRPVEHVAATSLPVGILPGASFRQTSLHLEEGDRLFVLSDGIPEARDARGEQLGWDRVHDVVSRGAARELEGIVSQLVGEATSRCGVTGPQDDVSLLALERTPCGKDCE